MGHTRPLFVYFRLFKQTLQFLQQMNVKNSHLVHGAGRQQKLVKSQEAASGYYVTQSWNRESEDFLSRL